MRRKEWREGGRYGKESRGIKGEGVVGENMGKQVRGETFEYGRAWRRGGGG